jgi:Putative metal-binding motif
VSLTSTRRLVVALAVALMALSSSPAAPLTLDAATIKGDLKLDKRKPANDQLALKGTFQPAAGSTPDLTAVAVTLTIGPFAQSLPPGSFRASPKGTKTTWIFRGLKGALTKLTIVRPATGSWTFDARGSGLSLPAAANPITLALQIGTDAGSQSRFFAVATSATRTIFKFPPGKKDDADGTTSAAGDCDDQDPRASPGAPERCDGVDNDCDGSVDEGFGLGGACMLGVGACQRSGITVCTADGSGAVCNATPGLPGTELCGNGIDDDCDGQTDEGFDVNAPCTVGTGSCQRTGVKISARRTAPARCATPRPIPRARRGQRSPSSTRRTWRRSTGC